jgi:3,4-dihydroxy-9,10-secoandrosta-1,3,5(10)-triene-9,17-dione 4,5-dioxygenase
MIDVKGLGYVVAESADPSRWLTFGTQVLGAMAFGEPEGGLRLKIDERPYRILVLRGNADRYVASGWEVANEQAFERAYADLEAAGARPRRATVAERAARRATGLLFFDDPSGNHHELFWGVVSDFVRFDSPQDVPRYVTGELGMGHTVLPAPKFDATWAFWRDVMGFGLSDIYNHRAGPEAAVQRLHFTHCNPRQHSLALFEAENPAGCVHIMLEVDSMTEVGRAMDRRAAHGAKLMASLGQHVNDDMTSFYMLTPSNFALEYGYGGKVVDWDRHAVFEATTISRWGHDWSLGLATGDTKQGR